MPVNTSNADNSTQSIKDPLTDSTKGENITSKTKAHFTSNKVDSASTAVTGETTSSNVPEILTSKHVDSTHNGELLYTLPSANYELSSASVANVGTLPVKSADELSTVADGKPSPVVPVVETSHDAVEKVHGETTPISLVTSTPPASRFVVLPYICSCNYS